MKQVIFIFIFILQFTVGESQNKFSFVFLPDLHLRSDSSVTADFNRVAKQVNKLHPDFIIAGGDMIYTAKNGDEKNARVLFDVMDAEFSKFKMPVHLTMGNHEVVGILPESGIVPSHPQWGKGMYQQRYGNRYKTFEFSGWKFFLLDGIEILEKEMNYTSGVDSVQMEWIKNELQKTDKSVPVVISIHTPLVNPKAMSDSKSRALSENAEAVLNLFNGYNLKMVLQGHNHKYMNLLVDGIHFISGGSTFYNDDLDSFDDGFLFVRIKDNMEKSQFVHTNRTAKIRKQ